PTSIRGGRRAGAARTLACAERRRTARHGAGIGRPTPVDLATARCVAGTRPDTPAPGRVAAMGYPPGTRIGLRAATARCVFGRGTHFTAGNASFPFGAREAGGRRRPPRRAAPGAALGRAPALLARLPA